jgi:hypothetical protein
MSQPRQDGARLFGERIGRTLQRPATPDERLVADDHRQDAARDQQRDEPPGD